MLDAVQLNRKDDLKTQNFESYPQFPSHAWAGSDWNCHELHASVIQLAENLPLSSVKIPAYFPFGHSQLPFPAWYKSSARDSKYAIYMKLHVCNLNRKKTPFDIWQVNAIINHKAELIWQMKSTDLSITPFLSLFLIFSDTIQATNGMITCSIIFRGSFYLFLSNALILGGVPTNNWLILTTYKNQDPNQGYKIEREIKCKK